MRSEIPVILTTVLLVLLHARPVIAESQANREGAKTLASSLSTGISVEGDGTYNRRVHFRRDNVDLLYRDRQTRSSYDWSAGVETPSISVGPLETRGIEQTAERGLAHSPLSDSLLTGGGVRLRRDDAFPPAPGIALRLPSISFFHIPDAMLASITGVAVERAVTLSDHDIGIRGLLIRSEPGEGRGGNDWLLDRRSPVEQTLWYGGFEVQSDFGRLDALMKFGNEHVPALLFSGTAKVRHRMVDFRASIGIAGQNFVTAAGQPTRDVLRAGLRLARPRKRLARPTAEATYRRSALSPVPGRYIEETYRYSGSVELGPDSLFVRPQWEEVRSKTASGGVARRQTAALRAVHRRAHGRVALAAEQRGLMRDDGEATSPEHSYFDLRAETRIAFQRHQETALVVEGALSIRWGGQANKAPLTVWPSFENEPRLGGRVRIDRPFEWGSVGVQWDIDVEGMNRSEYSAFLAAPQRRSELRVSVSVRDLPSPSTLLQRAPRVRVDSRAQSERSSP